MCPPLSPRQAADLAEAALTDTLEVVARCAADRRILALDGTPGPWVPPGFEVIPQRGRTFQQRLAAAWETAGGPGLQIGMDTPQVTPELLDHCLEAVSVPEITAGLGPASNGGWWAIALREGWDRDVFRQVPMSTPRTCAAQHWRLVQCGHRVRWLPTLRDVDVIDDAVAVAELVPESRFAHTFQAMEVVEC